MAVIGQYESFLTLLILILVAAYLIRRNDKKNKAAKSLVDLLNDFNFELGKSNLAICAFVDQSDNSLWFGKQEENEIAELLPIVIINRDRIIAAPNGGLKHGIILYDRNQEGVIADILSLFAAINKDFVGYKPTAAETE